MSTPKPQQPINPSIILIHGYSVGVEFSIFQRQKMEDGDFVLFKELLANGTAKLFQWYQAYTTLTFWKCLNPLEILAIYRAEERYIFSESAQKKLYEYLLAQKPATIVAHSMGAHYLLQTINKYGLPKNITRVFLLESDAPCDFMLTHSDILVRIAIGQLCIENHFCLLDQALWTSSLLHLKSRMGLVGTKDNHIVNQRFTEFPMDANVHVSPLRSTKLHKLFINPS